MTQPRQTPDPEDQPERTTLAWARTGLAATAAAAIMARLAVLEESTVIAVMAALVGVLALGGFVEGSSGHARRRSWFESHSPDRALPLAAHLTVVATFGLCLAGVALVVFA